jgi:RNA polymerase sigma-70 factor (ECF subfamily)
LTENSAQIAVLEDLKAQHGENYGWALACCSWQREMAEDLLQESYLRVLDGRARYGGKSALKTWFFAVIRTVAKETLRKQYRRKILNLRVVSPGLIAEETDGHTQPDAPDQLAQQNQSCNQLRQALMQLPVRQREVLHLVFYAEYTLEETANTLSISLGSVRTHYHRGKQRLAEQLQLEERDELG